MTEHLQSFTMTEAELVEIRARQRTFEGSYWRTCLASFGFSMVVLRLFEKVFYSIGMMFVVFGGAMLVISYHRRQSNMDVFDSSKPFVTGGRYVAMTGITCLTMYLTLIGLIVSL